MKTPLLVAAALVLMAPAAHASKRHWQEVQREERLLTQVDMGSLELHGDYDLMEVDVLLTPLQPAHEEPETRGVESVLMRARFDCHQPGRYLAVELTGNRKRNAGSFPMRLSNEWKLSTPEQSTMALWRMVCLPTD